MDQACNLTVDLTHLFVSPSIQNGCCTGSATVIHHASHQACNPVVVRSQSALSDNCILHCFLIGCEWAYFPLLLVFLLLLLLLLLLVLLLCLPLLLLLSLFCLLQECHCFEAVLMQSQLFTWLTPVRPLARNLHVKSLLCPMQITAGQEDCSALQTHCWC